MNNTIDRNSTFTTSIDARFAEPPFEMALEDGLTLRTARDERDVERVALFNGQILGPGVVAMTRDIFLYHPHTHARDLIYVEDGQGRVVSSICLIPWTLNYDGAQFTSGEMGIVGTAPEYRRRGLIRAQVKFYKQRLQERGCVLSHIQGIPYYYRQFGYEYAMPLEGGLRLTRRDFPDLPTSTRPTYSFRLAHIVDVPLLMRLYAEAAEETNIHTERDEAVWRYLLTHANDSETASETWIMQDATGRAVGYMRLPEHHFGDELTVNEVSRLSIDAACATLHHAAALAEERHTPGVRLCLPGNAVLARAARSFGAHDMGTYAWQIHIPDIATLLRAIGPALERRIRESPFAGLTRDLLLGFYRESVCLRFVAGKLLEVSRATNDDGCPNRMPPQAFAPLVLGYRSIEDLRLVYADLSISRADQLLIETLFPKVSAFLYTIY